MALNIQAIKGTKDTLPSESYKSQYIEQAALDTAKAYGFHEMRTPVFEYTELFDRSVGETTDVVQKEMYTFLDKGDRSVTLRPEGTAGAVRAFLEHGLFNEPLPQKVCYLTSCYRYEKPQAGRLREFHQFGIECFGAATAFADAEVIALANSYFTFLGLKNYTLEINSIGCPECRKKYSEALKSYFEDKKAELCETCLSRLERNPMRILDCKSPVCSKIAEGAPVVLDYICDGCREHFETLKKALESLNISYTVNPQIVRGLDYYTRTVFEFVSQDEKTKGLVLCGGGRYDGLVEELGGASMPACGLAIGLERLLMAMEESGVPFPQEPKCNLSIVTAGEKALFKALEISSDLRANGYSVNIDTVGRSIKAQMKYANKIGAEFTVVIGDNELESDKAKLKSMEDGAETEVSLSSFDEGFERAFMDKAVSEFQNADFGKLTQADIDNLLK
ncbi:MAG: histidine--tRNA ligase [Oscillospiraceae bacterium]|nr:histidine--tRNA ligase [Oscillospiraceae bacterium]